MRRDLVVRQPLRHREPQHLALLRAQPGHGAGGQARLGAEGGELIQPEVSRLAVAEPVKVVVSVPAKAPALVKAKAPASGPGATEIWAETAGRSVGALAPRDGTEFLLP